MQWQSIENLSNSLLFDFFYFFPNKVHAFFVSLLPLYSEKEASSSKAGDRKIDASGGIVLEEVLEEAPKWKVLRVSE